MFVPGHVVHRPFSRFPPVAGRGSFRGSSSFSYRSRCRLSCRRRRGDVLFRVWARREVRLPAGLGAAQLFLPPADAPPGHSRRAFAVADRRAHRPVAPQARGDLDDDQLPRCDDRRCRHRSVSADDLSAPWRDADRAGRRHPTGLRIDLAARQLSRAPQRRRTRDCREPAWHHRGFIHGADRDLGNLPARQPHFEVCPFGRRVAFRTL